jgi:hypothetical protein
MNQDGMKGIRQLTQELGLSVRSLKKALVESRIVLDNGTINPLAIEMRIAKQIGVYVNGVKRSKIVYSKEVINQMVNGEFNPIEILEEELPF